MKIAPAFLDEIKARVPVSEVVRRQVKLTKRGNEFVGLSPFNNEKTPSFTVNDQKGFYHCFSSGQHGDIISFLMDVEGLSFMESIETLASMAGLQVPKPTPQEYEKHQKQKTLYDVMELTCSFFEAQLQSPNGDSARGYLADRGVAGEVQKHFRIGYGPKGRHDLLTYLKSKNVPLAMMIEAGVVIGGGDIKEPYDRYRDRIIFPIHNGSGKIAGFGGRALSPEARAKYINSPETPIYHKGDMLYHQFQARKSAHTKSAIIAVEGYMDVVAMYMAGIEHCVAPLGTALTQAQIELMWRMAPEPVLCFDGDSAGLKAAYKAADLALSLLKPGYSLRFVLLPEGQDPDDILKNEGREALHTYVGKNQSLIDLLWLREVQEHALDTPERRAHLETRFEELVDTINDKKIRHHYLSEFRDRLSALWRNMRVGNSKRGAQKYSRQTQYRPRGVEPWEIQQKASSSLKAHAGANLVKSAAMKREKLLIWGILQHPHIVEDASEDIAHISFLNAELDRLLSETLDIASQGKSIDSSMLHNHLEDRGLQPLLTRLSSDLSAHKPWFFADTASAVDAETGWRHIFALHKKSQDLQKELKAAELKWSKESNQENFEVLNDILRQIESIEGKEVSPEGFGDVIRPTGT